MASLYNSSSGERMDRIYLFVPPEEYSEVKASGALWDNERKSWYIGEDVAPANFARWLAEEDGNTPFGIMSVEAFVASAHCRCVNCQKDIEIICLFCASGRDTEIGHPLRQFTVSNIWAMDDALGRALERWPHFRQGTGEGSGAGGFANHCPHCGVMQEDYLLHSEPGDVFFGIAPDRPGTVKFTPLEGRIRLSGNYGFEP